MRATATMRPIGAPPCPGSGADASRVARRAPDASVPEPMARVTPPVGADVDEAGPGFDGVVDAPVEPGPFPWGVVRTGFVVGDDGDTPDRPGSTGGRDPEGTVEDGAPVVGGLDGVDVVVVGGPDDGHRVGASDGERGGGSAGVALPSGSNRHPSTSPGDTGHDAGPTLE